MKETMNSGSCSTLLLHDFPVFPPALRAGHKPSVSGFHGMLGAQQEGNRPAIGLLNEHSEWKTWCASYSFGDDSHTAIQAHSRNKSKLWCLLNEAFGEVGRTSDREWKKVEKWKSTFMSEIIPIISLLAKMVVRRILHCYMAILKLCNSFPQLKVKQKVQVSCWN